MKNEIDLNKIKRILRMRLMGAIVSVVIGFVIILQTIGDNPLTNNIEKTLWGLGFMILGIILALINFLFVTNILLQRAKKVSLWFIRGTLISMLLLILLMWLLSLFQQPF